jgi:hypothetical protein
MVSTVAINPIMTTNAAGSFSVDTVGLIQGMMYDDPAVRYALAGGVLDALETLPMWGGVGISEYVPGASGKPNGVLGGPVRRATNLTAAAALTLTGFSVFNQDHSMISSPQSPVPLAAANMGVNFFRLGSGARIAVACDPALVSLDGGVITQQVSWDFTSQLLVPYTPAYNATTITGAVWASTSGGRTTFTVGTDLTADLSAGSNIDVSGVVSTGGTGVGFNGRFVVVSVTSTTIVVTQVAASSPGTYSSGGTVAAGGGLLPIKGVLEIDVGNSLTVSYDPTTGFATWNRSGSCAVILI